MPRVSIHANLLQSAIFVPLCNIRPISASIHALESVRCWTTALVSPPTGRFDPHPQLRMIVGLYPAPGRLTFRSAHPRGMRQGGGKIFAMVSIHVSLEDTTILRSFARTETVISIHASPRDATILRSFTRAETIVSIHASLEDAIAYRALGCRLFQSTHPLRDATRYDRAAVAFAVVSIHASL